MKFYGLILSILFVPNLMARPAPLPHPGGTGSLTAWGGGDASRWQPEAILANAASVLLNEMWQQDGVKDVVVAIPTKLYDSGFNPYGDGQTNSEVSLHGWQQKRPPFVAALVQYNFAASRVYLRFDRAWNLNQTALELRYKTGGNSPWRTVVLPGTKVDGDLQAVWSDLPAALNWDDPGQTIPAFVRPHPGFNDWLQFYFRMPRHSVEDFVASMPESSRSFPDGKPIVDPENLANSPGTTPFEKASNHRWPAFRYNVGNLGQNGIPQPYIPENVHAEIGAGGRKTAVGKGYTWVAEQQTPFKAMYTCFDGRNLAAESQFGVPSGSGWHVIGDPAITFINALEDSAILVGEGYTNPGIRFDTELPDNGFTYGLADVAVFKQLQPGEVFVTAATVFPDRDQDHQWYAIQADRPMCTEEHVHPCIPTDHNADFSCQ